MMSQKCGVRKMEATDEINEKAMEILKSGKLMDVYLETFSTYHEGDIHVAKMILLSTTLQHITNANGCYLEIIGEPGSGRKHAVEMALHLIGCPVVRIDRLTVKSLRALDDCQDGTVVFIPDTESKPDSVAKNMVRTAVDNWQTSTSRLVTVGGHAKLFKIPARTLFIFTRTRHSGDPQAMSVLMEAVMTRP